MPLAELALNPRNPRNDGLPDDLSDLDGIRERQLQSCLAITVEAYLALWPTDHDRFDDRVTAVIINGNRRRRAASKYGRDKLFVVTDDTIATSRAAVMRAAYDENVARRDFDPIEEALAVVDIAAEYETAKEAATAQGWSQSWVSHRKNLLRLHPELQEEVRAKARGGDGLSINVARRLGAVKGISSMELDEQRQALAELMRGDAEASQEQKAARLRARAERQRPKAEHPSASAPQMPAEAENDAETADTIVASSPAEVEFSAENSTGPVVPEQRPTPSAEGELEGQGNAGQYRPEAPRPDHVPITLHVPAGVASTFQRVADHLSQGHRVPVSVEDVVGMVATFASRTGSPPLAALSDQIESRYGIQLGDGITRFTWRLADGGGMRTVERHRQGHPPSGGVYPRCAAPTGPGREPCDHRVIWKVEDGERGIFFYCGADLPSGDTPPGVWRQ
ncbi:ParB/RepB/Spo0J family partition protein [Streptomyces sp. NPDC090106]|uniref:ParB/RepB/Spo0J family partition protein n=1 Tax=Streptomyces sp. NPDC090106 TaxID=3365946 RepID=UPI0037F61609